MNQETRIEYLGPLELIGVPLYGNPNLIDFTLGTGDLPPNTGESSRRTRDDVYGQKGQDSPEPPRVVHVEEAQAIEKSIEPWAELVHILHRGGILFDEGSKN